ncbi:hypothetical protein YC2023_103794 [Brassica napus]
MANTELVTEKDIYGDDLFRCYYQTLMESVQKLTDFVKRKERDRCFCHAYHLYPLKNLPP